MPTVLRWHGYRFFFFSDEGDPLEPCHIHVAKGDAYLKIWVGDDVVLDKAYDLSAPEINKVIRVVEENKTLIKEKWNEYFSA